MKNTQKEKIYFSIQNMIMRNAQIDLTCQEKLYTFTGGDIEKVVQRIVRYFASRSLQIQNTPMTPAKKAGTKVKKVNALKKAVTAKAKKALKAKKK